MSRISAQTFTLLDSIKEFFLRFAASGVIPGRWFNAKLPPEQERHRAELPLTLEIVSHCWKYSEFQLYQLSSLVNHPPTQLNIIHTVYYSKTDADTVRILNFFENKTISNVRWNFIALPKEKLFRRAIGRNMAALNTTADWIWFTDCDVVFHQGALDTLAQQLAGRTDALVYPQTMYITQLLKKDDPLITKAKAELEVLEIDTSELSTRYFTRATGPIQITHGDVARACGYCADLAVYQKPMARWSKCYEDRAFRWLLGTKGTP
ncbi:MAG TPA: glycosyltransferase family A protein, partial [Cellvibrionaceae bacterium]